MTRKLTTEEQSAHINSIKRLIELFREHASEAFVSVRTTSLHSLYVEAEVNDYFRPHVIAQLIEGGYLVTTGKGGGLHYKWKEQSNIIVDAEALANLCFEYIRKKGIDPKKSYPKRVPLETVDESKLHKSSVTVVEPTPKRYGLSDKVYLLQYNAIIEAQVVGMRYALVGEDNINNPSNNDADDEETRNPDMERIIYAVRYWIPTKFVTLQVESQQLYPSLELLLKGLEIKFKRK